MSGRSPRSPRTDTSFPYTPLSRFRAAGAIVRGGDEAQKRAWLPKLASGETVGTFALAGGTGPATAAGLTTRFENGTVSGVKLPVLDTDMADMAIVSARGAAGSFVL